MAEIKDPYGFIYITTCLVNGKRYLGQKKFDRRWKNYLGSGRAFKDSVKKYGAENFRREIVTVCNSLDELNTAEYVLSVFFDVVASRDWYNEVYGGGTTAGYRQTNETKEKRRASKQGYRHSDETIEKIRNSHKGFKYSEESKARMSLAQKSRPVRCVETNTVYRATKEAERQTGIDQANIIKVCRGKQKTAGGYHWEYATKAG